MLLIYFSYFPLQTFKRLTLQWDGDQLYVGPFGSDPVNDFFLTVSLF